MTKTELDLMIEMRDVLVPFKGEWQVGDRYYCKDSHRFSMGIGICGIQRQVGCPAVGKLLGFPSQLTQ